MQCLDRLIRTLIIAVAAIAPAAYCAQPPDVVSTDAGGNTAMGTSALVNLTGGIVPGDSAGETTQRATNADMPEPVGQVPAGMSLQDFEPGQLPHDSDPRTATGAPTGNEGAE